MLCKSLGSRGRLQLLKVATDRAPPADVMRSRPANAEGERRLRPNPLRQLPPNRMLSLNLDLEDLKAPNRPVATSPNRLGRDNRSFQLRAVRTAEARGEADVRMESQIYPSFH